jgi:hypothetical protein
MVDKRTSRWGGAEKRAERKIETVPVVSEKLDNLAERMLLADGKNPYFKGDLVIHNLAELSQHIESFEHHEVPWVADWIEYLGDAETADKIRGDPSRFKKIVCERHAELKRQFR